MTKTRKNTILPILLGAALFVGSAWVYTPVDAEAHSISDSQQTVEESVFTPR